MQRRRSALVSVVGHAVFIAVLALIGTRAQSPSLESPLILAELVTALEPSSTSVEAVAPEIPEAPAEESVPAPQPPAAEVTTAPDAAPPPPPPVEPETPRTVEPASAPPIEQLVEVELPD